MTALAQARKPNILVIMGDDIGWYNTSHYCPANDLDPSGKSNCC